MKLARFVARPLSKITRCKNYLLASWFRTKPVSLGARSELLAERFLKRRGMKIVGRNYRDRMGEIDIVAVDKRTVVFVEVKCRTSDDHGAGFEAVDEKKQQKMARTALTFLQRHDLLENAYRFDIVSMLWPPNQSQPQIEHFPNAFQPTAKNQMFG